MERKGKPQEKAPLSITMLVNLPMPGRRKRKRKVFLIEEEAEARVVSTRKIFLTEEEAVAGEASSSQTDLLKKKMEVAAKSGDYKEAARLRDSLDSLIQKTVDKQRFTYDLLKKQMEVAANSGDYKEAAKLRDSLIEKAVEEQRFEDAARYRDELTVSAPHSLLKCSSDATTLGIRVQVKCVYIECHSQSSKGQYYFGYSVRITNNSLRPVQLLRRHWIITDGSGNIENIWGVDVIGNQPVIAPTAGLEYLSACHLRTPNGRMEGDFEMKHIDKVGLTTFNAAIAPFSLDILGDDTCPLLNQDKEPYVTKADKQKAEYQKKMKSYEKGQVQYKVEEDAEMSGKESKKSKYEVDCGNEEEVFNYLPLVLGGDS